MGLPQPMYHSVWEARKLRLQQPWVMVFLWCLEGPSADYMCTLGGGTPGSPSVMSAAHKQDTALTGLAIMSTYKEEHHGKSTKVLLKFPKEAMFHLHPYPTISLIVVFPICLYSKASFLILCIRGTQTIEIVFTNQCPQTV